MAAAVLAGVNPVQGLYASFAGPIAGGLTSNTRLMVITTTSAAALAAGSALQGVAPAQRPAAVPLLVILVGVVLVAAGIAQVMDVPVLGERGGNLYVDPKSLPAHAQVVTEGGSILTDGDPVRATVDPWTVDVDGDAGVPARGGGFGRPL